MAENKKFLDKDGVTYLQKKNNQTLQAALQATVEVIGEELAKIEIIKAKSAYDIAVDEGFDGSEEEWLASLKGPKGDAPVLGTDYWTDADKQYIINEVLATLPIAEESEF